MVCESTTGSPELFWSLFFFLLFLIIYMVTVGSQVVLKRRGDDFQQFSAHLTRFWGHRATQSPVVMTNIWGTQSVQESPGLYMVMFRGPCGNEDWTKVSSMQKHEPSSCAMSLIYFIKHWGSRFCNVCHYTTSSSEVFIALYSSPSGTHMPYPCTLLLSHNLNSNIKIQGSALVGFCLLLYFCLFIPHPTFEKGHLILVFWREAPDIGTM